MTETLFEYDHILMLSQYRTPDIHTHLAVHLIVGLGAMLHCRVGDSSFDAKAVIIASDAKHTVYSDSGEMLVFLFDPASRYAGELKRLYLHSDSFTLLDEEQTQTINSLWQQHSNDLAKADKAILEYLGLGGADNLQLDTRVAEALEILKEMDEVPQDAVGYLCERVFLSKSRLSHLFKQNLGISLSRYLAWEKMRKGFIHFRTYGSITDAALMAGFDSPSHFAATCKRMFGLSFSEYTKS
ncbi:MAG: helix-turn-helix transcriptional regulator [Ruminococcus sp.]|nr:helix-turn-helix transcriptional regulator [Ruminococcus sp.]